jgi:hypothetical protein
MGLINTVLDAGSSLVQDLLGSSSSTSAVDTLYSSKLSTQNIFEVKTFYNEYFESKAGVSQSDFLSFAKTYLVDFNISELQNNDIEEWVNYKWYYTPGKPNINKITFTFRDNNSYFMYTYFKNAWWNLKDRLPDEQKWNIQVNSVNDYNGHLLQSLSPITILNGSSILDVKDAVLDSVSGLSLDKSDAHGFVTFSVTFRYFINYTK